MRHHLEEKAAGLVIIQKQHNTSGSYSSDDIDQTIYVHDNMQKEVTDWKTFKDHKLVVNIHQVVITDLSKGITYNLNPNTKTYWERNVRPKGSVTYTYPPMTFKKTGTTREVAGYKCADYSASWQTTHSDYTVTKCLSASAPGAEKFDSFQKHFAEEFPTQDEIPDGVPLVVEKLMKTGDIAIAGMSEEQAAKINAAAAKTSPFVSTTIVEKIETRRLPENEFAIPKDYTEVDPAAQMLQSLHLGNMKMSPGIKMIPGPP